MERQIRLKELVPKGSINAQQLFCKEEFLQMGIAREQNNRIDAGNGDLGNSQLKHINYLSCRLVRDQSQEYLTRKIASPDDVEKIAIEVLGLDEKDVEAFYVLHLTSRVVVSAISLISIGSICETICHPREVFKTAILNNSATIILVHNHPSGDSNPSGNDRATTDRLVEAGKIIGVKVLDHIIIGHGNNMFSFKENGLI